MIAISAIPIIGGHPVIDFVNTVESRHRTTEIDYLASPIRFAHWAAHVGLISSSHVGSLQRRAVTPRAHLVWRKAKQLRDDLHETSLAIACGETLPILPLGRIMEVAKWATSQSGLYEQGERLSVQPLPSKIIHEQALIVLAHSAVALLTSEDIERVRKCAHEACDWLFLDRSRNGRRRWCRMEACGNRCKVRRHRAKSRKVK